MKKTIKHILTTNSRTTLFGQLALFVFGVAPALFWVALGSWVLFFMLSGFRIQSIIMMLALYLPALIGTLGLGWSVVTRLYQRPPRLWHSLFVVIGIMVMSFAYFLVSLPQREWLLELSMLLPLASGLIVLAQHIRYAIRSSNAGQDIEQPITT